MDQSRPPWRVLDAATDGTTPSSPASRESAASDRLTSIGIQPIALLGVFAAAMLGVLAIFIAMSGMPHEAVVAGPGGSFGLSASGDPDPGAAKLVVNVAGAVVNPGIYRLPVGSRVGDAVLAAGGYGPRVDVARVGAELNLAAPLTDGVQIRVPSRDDPQAVGGGPGSGTSAGSGGQGAAPGGVINLNTASQSELESLPGIGPVTATKIIAARAQTPFRTIDEVRERGLVGEKTFDSIRALITV